MKNLQFTKLQMANDDLELVIKSLELFSKSNVSDNQKIDAKRIIWLLSQLLNPEIYDYSNSQIINQ